MNFNLTHTRAGYDLVAEVGARQIFAHTHPRERWVLMLRPTRSASGAPYPLREKWVRDAVAYYLARDSPMRKYRL